MRQFATALFGLGIAIVTFAVTRYSTFREYAPPAEPGASEGDPRFIIAIQHLIILVVIGFITLSLSGYLYGRGKRIDEILYA